MKINNFFLVMKMKEIYPSEVPLFLRNTEYFLSLSEDEPFLIEDKYLKESEIVSSDKELKYYILTSEYWGYDLSENISESAIEFIENNKNTAIFVCMKILKKKDNNTAQMILDSIENLSYDLNLKWIFATDRGDDFLFLSCSFNNKILWSHKMNNYEDLEGKFQTLSDYIVKNKKYEFYIYKKAEKIKCIYKDEELSFDSISDISRGFISENSFKIPINFLNKKKISECLVKMDKTYNDPDFDTDN